MNAISKVTKPATQADLVDQLGILKAQIAALEDQAKVITTNLKGTGAGIYTGTLFDATVSAISRETLDSAAVRAYFERTPAGKRWIKAHTNVVEYLDCRVKARVQRAA